MFVSSDGLRRIFRLFCFKGCLLAVLVFGLCAEVAQGQAPVKLATHNSLTYLRPQWYFRWLNFVAKCQNLNIEEQYRLGVRYFDFRVKFAGEKIRAGHGMMTYEADFDRIYAFLNEKGGCIVNLILENHRWQGKKREERFVVYARKLTEEYPDIRFVGGYKKNPWVSLIHLGDYPVKPCFEFYKGKNFKFPYPKRYARKKNEGYWAAADTSMYSMFDFIEIHAPEQ